MVTLKDGTQASSQFPAPAPDPDGRVCPFVGHIRKVNPRDDATDAGGPNDTLRRLMLRRGIPYGPPKDRTRLFEDDGVDRGLLFMSYQGIDHGSVPFRHPNLGQRAQQSARQRAEHRA